MTTHSTDSCRASHRRRRHHQAHRARKERVLHTRVSEQLSEDIRNFAEALRVPASNLVRNVLEEVFTVVERVSDDVGDLFDDLIEEAEGVRERVRNQAASSHRRNRFRSRRGNAGRRAGGDADADREADIEAEFERDEASEKTSGASKKGTGVRRSPPPDEDRPSAAELFPEILGWQPLVLNRDSECGRCTRRLAAGESAFLGLGEKGLTQTALCGDCASVR